MATWDWVQLERAAAVGWRAPEQYALGEWLLRAAGGFTGRANSALALGDPGRPLAQALAEVGDFYRSRGLTPVLALPHPLGAQVYPLDQDCAAAGWRVRDGASALVMTAPAPARGAPLGGRADVVCIESEPGPHWLALYRYRGTTPPPAARGLLLSAPEQAFASVRDADGTALAIGRVAIAAGWAGLTAVEVSPQHRRQGLGTAVTQALMQIGADRGADGIYLQVAEHNTAAQALYAGLGFTPSHRYHYRVAPD